MGSFQMMTFLNRIRRLPDETLKVMAKTTATASEKEAISHELERRQQERRS